MFSRSILMNMNELDMAMIQQAGSHMLGLTPRQPRNSALPGQEAWKQVEAERQ